MRSAQKPVNSLRASESLCKKHKVLQGVSLRKFNTLRIAGVAEFFAEPKSRAELLELLKDCWDAGIPYRILGRGSNVFLANDTIDGLVIRTVSVNQPLNVSGRDIKVGAGESLQKLLIFAARQGLGGLDYLYSVPGNVGGAIFMNAGRGKCYKRSIEDFIVGVEVFESGRVWELSRRQCEFAYRRSVFQQMPEAVILSTHLRMPRCDPAKAINLLQDRVKLTKRVQDNSAPNAGSVFRAGFEFAERMRGMKIGEACFSNKTTNWILNNGDGNYRDIAALLQLCAEMHSSVGKPAPEVEWSIWQ